MPVLTALVATSLLLLVLAPLAHKVGLVDRPSARKQHQGHIPLIGGLAIYIALVVMLFMFSTPTLSERWYLAACGVLVLVGVLDDRLNMPVGIRIASEVVAGLMMMFGANIWVGYLGNLLGFGDINMPLWLSASFTLIAVFGIINAWNMIDGVDGLLGSLCLLGVLSYLWLTTSGDMPALLPLILLGALLAYLLFNMSLLPKVPKVFLGDAGSKFLGFTMVWLLIDATQRGELTQGKLFPPVLALFLVGLPLIDMVITTLRRLQQGKPPFIGDRTHIHHILLDGGLSARQVLLTISLLMGLFIGLGIAMVRLKVPDYGVFAVFLLLTLSYPQLLKFISAVGRQRKQQSG